MAFVSASRVKETSTTTGTGNLTLDGAVSKFRAFSAVYANNDTFSYSIVHSGAAEWEVGIGTYVSATPAIARTTVLASSNAGALVNFSEGTKDVFVAPLGERYGYFDALFLKDTKFQSFVITIVNTAGTLQHQITAEHPNISGTASDWAEKIVGASAALANTPTVGAGVDFTSGVGINANRIVFNTAAQTVAPMFGIALVESYSGNVGSFCPISRYVFVSRDVNGTTRIRLEIGLNHPYTDAAWTINTTNLPSGAKIVVRVLGALA